MEDIKEDIKEKCRLLIVDDHVIIRQGIKSMLAETPAYQVVGECGDGLQVISLMRKLKPDVVLLDISLPNIRGIELIRKIKKLDRQIKILVLTMHKNEEYVYECLADGAAGYMLKDDADTDLRTAIKQVLDGRLYVSSSFSSDVIKNLIERVQQGGKESPYRLLTVREREILKLTAEGDTNKTIARKLGISSRTVENHRARLMKKIGVVNTAGLVKYALKHGLVDLT